MFYFYDWTMQVNNDLGNLCKQQRFLEYINKESEGIKTIFVEGINKKSF